MAKEDILLGVEMGRLEIEPAKLKSSRKDDNPFLNYTHQKHNLSKRPFMNNCSCTTRKQSKTSGIVKKKHNGVLTEPVLKILKHNGKNNTLDVTECPHPPFINNSQNVTLPTHNLNTDTLNLCTLVQTCTQLKISGRNECSTAATDLSNDNKWWRNVSEPRPVTEYKQSSQAGSCSQQALNPPCDITIDELASYFETLVHIPKKMSSMAEMMYI